MGPRARVEPGDLGQRDDLFDGEPAAGRVQPGELQVDGLPDEVEEGDAISGGRPGRAERFAVNGDPQELQARPAIEDDDVGRRSDVRVAAMYRPSGE